MSRAYWRARELRDPRLLLAIAREVRTLRRENPGLLVDLSAEVPADARHVLVVSLSDDPEQIRLEGLLTKALQAHGGRVTTLAYRRGAPWSRELLRALRIRSVVYFDDFTESGDVLTPALADELAQCRTVADFKRFTISGVRVGRQALSTVVRTRRVPTIDLDDPGVRAELQRTIAYAVSSTRVADRILDHVRPDCVLTVERGYAGFGSFSDRALVRDIPVIQFQSAHRDDAYYLKRYSVETRDLHARSLDDSTWERLQALGMTPEREDALAREMASQQDGRWFLARRNRSTTEAGGAAQLRERLRLDPERKVAAVYSHVLWDASMFYGTDIYPDQGRWFEETVRLACEDDRVQWLIKLHPALYWMIRFDGSRERPAELDMIRDVVGDLPPHVRLLLPDAQVSNVDLFELLDVGITIRGTVGIELPPLGVPVITAGTSDYSGRGFTIDADTVEEYEANIRAIPDIEPLDSRQIQLARLYAFGIFCARPWKFTSFALDFLPVNESTETLRHRLRYNLRTRAELEAAPDLAEFSDWVLRHDEPDFVDEASLASSLVPVR